MTQTETLNAIGIEAICQRILDGETQRDIAKSLDMQVGNLNAWINHPDRIEQSARARQESAESWLDNGLDAVKTAMNRENNIDSGAAKAYAQECARRAALRNPQYRDKTAHEVSGPNGGAIEFTEIERRIIG